MKNPLRVLIASLLVSVSPAAFAQDGDTPYIIFISENTPAKTAIESVIIAEYNAEQREALRVTDLDAWENYEEVTSYRSIPNDYKNPRYDELKALLGLEDDDPSDKGFTDVLEAAGYEVHRSETTVIEDPITGAVTFEHEFWGDVGEPFSANGDYRLSEEQITFLSEADLIIMSMDLTPNRYSAGGRKDGESSYDLINQWNGIEVPIIAMNNILMGTMEFGSWGWGWSYGFSGQWNTLVPFDRRAIQGSERFVFPDLRPAVVNEDPDFFAGVTPVDGHLAIYKDYNEVPFLPRVQRKFSNNENYAYAATSTVLLELDLPSFVDTEVGDIPHRNPVMIEFPANIQAFNPTNGVPEIGRVANPAGPRLYFAAGIRDTGLYNLSDTGEQVFLNAVAKYAGGGNGGTNTWLGFEVDENGWANTENWLGWVNVEFAPYIWILSLDKYGIITDGSGWIYVGGALNGDAGDWLGYDADENGWANTESWLGWVNVEYAPYIWILAMEKYGIISDNTGWVYVSP